MKLIGCNGVAEMYGQLGGICQGYMCIFLYVKLIGCNGVAEMYSCLEEGVELVCHRYMCILLYLKLIRCNSVA